MPKRRRRARVPIAPKIGTRIGLPYLAVVADDGPLPTHAQPSGGARGRSERDGPGHHWPGWKRDLLPDDLRLRLQHEARPERQRDGVATFKRRGKAGAVDRQQANCVIALPS